MTDVRTSLSRMIDDALDDDPRAALIAARQLEEECEWLMRRAVASARREGWNWARIGRLIDMTRQGARKRFPAVPPFAPPSSIASDRALRGTRETERMLREWDRRRRNSPADDDPIAW
jgi:hypothetical protein